MASGGRFVLGVDSGGSGVRVALAPARADGTVTYASPPVVSGTPVRTGSGGIDADDMAGQVVPAARALLARAGGGSLAAVCVGAAGMATLGDALRARLPGLLAGEFGVRPVALAADAVTAYAGALGQRPGAVVAAGTGLIALGTDLTAWRRADGWGHLLGDCGGGAWIGRAGLAAALRAHDGRRGGSAALLARLEAVFGPAPELPGRLYPRTDRPAVLASFAPQVAGCAAEGDPVAVDILRDAARHVAETAAAACPAPAAGNHSPTAPCEVALTGGLLKLGAPLLVPLHEQFARALPHARLVDALGSPLDGAVRIATALAADNLSFPADPYMLCVSGHQTR
ncbi:ATPase [Streptomyces sp. NBC_00237]|uniref:N-acetylglucosamine kinase n=1 Tax=Streptomyces sp. NBC_00237 TaxID=2975687 RepID=UPI002252408C|nr:BadF/BadG/BcrA/BcrD ATPase family protein [Streptomyces sp. NBC_00237]MCX5207051.1 ATPase [Streptomyces sp. NBC_00237]